MTERIKSLLERTFDKGQRKFRRDVDWKPLLNRFIDEGVGDMERARIGLQEMLNAETPAFMDGERIAFLRTVKQIPDLHSDKEMDDRRAQGVAFGEKGVVFNITADFGSAIRDGLGARLDEMRARLICCREEGDAEGADSLEIAVQSASTFSCARTVRR